jgi:DNA-binding NarL/FixJ family response regulator
MTVARIDAEDDLIVVRETERHRIARDLHEEALQDLTEALDKAIANEPAETLVPALERVGEQLRVAIYDLRLGGEQGRPFGERLRSMVRVHRVIAGDCRVELHVADGVPAGPLGAVGTEVLRILAEALNNARRHAGARHVEVRVSATETDLRAEVSDDGRGFDPGVAATGIRGMHERAQLIEGRLDLRSEPGAGTRVRVEVPLPEREGPGRDVRIVLVEDHAAVREAIASAFEREAGFRVVGQAGTLRDARRMLADVDVVILDLRLPDGDGAELIKDLQDVNPQAQAVVLTAALDRVEIARAVRYGAAGAINKTAHLDEVIDAVRRLHAGQTLLPPDEVIALLRLAERHTRAEDAERRTAETLTLRERQVLQALAEGLDTQAVAGHLHISVRTVRNHAANILTKLGVHSQLQAVLFAVRNDVVDIGTTRGDRG